MDITISEHLLDKAGAVGLAQGSKCAAIFNPGKGKLWEKASVLSIDADGAFHIQWDDGHEKRRVSPKYVAALRPIMQHNEAGGAAGATASGVRGDQRGDREDEVCAHIHIIFYPR